LGQYFEAVRAAFSGIVPISYLSAEERILSYQFFLLLLSARRDPLGVIAVVKGFFRDRIRSHVSIHARDRATRRGKGTLSASDDPLKGEVSNRRWGDGFSMKTRCPDCQTVFRVTPEQIRTRAGKVRCGYCQAVFNALDALLDEGHSDWAANPVNSADPPDTYPDIRIEPVFSETTREIPPPFSANVPEVPEAENGERHPPCDTPSEVEEMDGPDGPDRPDEPMEPGFAAGLMFPRETGKTHGYSKWAEGVMAPPIAFPAEKPSRGPFWLAAAGLALALAAQAVFHFRGPLAVSMPRLRPALEALSSALNSPLPLPRHGELISIEASDLQTDTARGNLLVLNTTLRNNAPYGQAYPSLELSLTDTQDRVIARRIFSPQDYLPARVASAPDFPGHSGVAVRLWIEAVDLAAAGYRLLVFYP
jgi:predicted Zn finger-like uncharacterized protein